MQKKKRRMLAMGTAVGLLALVLALAVWITEANIRPIILSMAEARVRAIAMDAINQSIYQNMQGVSYDELVTATLNNAGQVTMLSANTMAMNDLSTATALSAQQRITDMQMQPVRISLGSATGFPLFAGKGPSMVVNVEPAGSVSSEFFTEFTAAGINQSRHRIYMQLSATVRIVIPTGAKLVQVNTMVPIAETVIVGEVPDSFIHVPSMSDALNLVP